MLKQLDFQWDNFLGGGLLLFGMGAFFIIRAFVVVTIGLTQGGWVETEGVVSRRETTTSYSQERTRTNYHFAYRYEVDGEMYTHNRYSARQLSPSERAGYNAYELGQTIPVYYNPNRPGQAVAVRERPSLFVILGFGFGIFMVIFGFGLTFMGDIGGLFYYQYQSQMDRLEASYAAFGAKFKSRLHNEPHDLLLLKMIAEMPRELKQTLHKYAQNGNFDFGVEYLNRKTGLPEPICQKIMSRIEQETSTK